jgi:hypothetical protein
MRSLADDQNNPRQGIVNTPSSKLHQLLALWKRPALMQVITSCYKKVNDDVFEKMNSLMARMYNGYFTPPSADQQLLLLFVIFHHSRRLYQPTALIDLS